MCEKEFYKVASMSYAEYCDYLQGKYGKSKYNYFSTNWSRNPKVSRTKEGLFTHHKYENQGIMLSEAKYAKNNPYEWQLAENLVYCNYLEHFILHLKIFEMRMISLKNTIWQIFFKDGVINHLVPKLNDIYHNMCQNKSPWHQTAVSLIKNDAQDYFTLRDNVLEKILKNFSNLMYGETRMLTENKLY